MGLYISGVEMPQNCQSCNFYNGLGCEATGRMFSLLYNVATRRSDCPLIEVPEPHGRMIDADAMIRDIEKSLAPSWYIKERNADMVKFLSLEDTIIPASEED